MKNPKQNWENVFFSFFVFGSFSHFGPNCKIPLGNGFSTKSTPLFLFLIPIFVFPLLPHQQLVHSLMSKWKIDTYKKKTRLVAHVVFSSGPSFFFSLVNVPILPLQQNQQLIQNMVHNSIQQMITKWWTKKMLSFFPPAPIFMPHRTATIWNSYRCWYEVLRKPIS